MPIRQFPKKFQVAFSFAGEQRDLLRAIAETVEKDLGQATVFWDEWFEYALAGHDADLKLQKIYGDDSELVVVCVSGHYGDKPWTRTEHETIRARLMKIRSSQDKRDELRILPIRVGEGEVEGILFNTIVPDVRGRSAAQTAELILSRLNVILQNPIREKAEALAKSCWPKEPVQFKHGLADRQAREWPAIVGLLTSDSRKRVLIFEGPSGYSKSALLGAAARYARVLRVSTAYVDFKDTKLLSETNMLRELQLGLDRVLPSFSAHGDPDRWALCQSFRMLKEPVLILLDTYEKVSETKELVEWIETRLLAEAEECEHLRFVIAGQKVPDSARARWGDCAETVKLERIYNQRIWQDWVREINPNVDEKHVEGIVLGLEGLQGRRFPCDVLGQNSAVAPSANQSFMP